MKKWLLILVILLVGCTTGNVVSDLPDNFAQAESELMALGESYKVPSSDVVDSFVNEFGSEYSLKVYDTQWFFFEDEFIWYKVTLNGDKIDIERAVGPLSDWNLEIKASNVPAVIDSIENLNSISDIVSLGTKVGTDPDSQKLRLISWINSLE